MVDYLIPKTLIDTLEFINNNESKIISGATDLLVQRKQGAEITPNFTKKPVFIFNIKELKYIRESYEFIYIGACTPVSDLLNHVGIPKLLKKSIEVMASPALRNLATLPGNIVNASPAGDTLPILYALNASVKIQTLNSKRIVKVRDVITGPRRTILKSNEMITEVLIPKVSFTKEDFIKVGGRKADAISKISFTYGVNIKENIITDLRLVFGAVGPVMVRRKELEEKYTNIEVSKLKELKQEILNDYQEFITPINDQRSSKEYRKKVALNLLSDLVDSL